MRCLKFVSPGKDNKAWSMYIDRNRSWCLQGGAHVNRMDGGITAGNVVGLLLDVDRATLSFFVNGAPRVGIPVSADKPSMFFPAVGINRNATVTLQCGFNPSSIDRFSDDD